MSGLTEPSPTLSPELIYRDTRQPERDALVRLDLVQVDAQLIEYLKRHPEKMYELQPRRFEELVAEMLRDMGYQTELTVSSADGGVDIIATQKTGIGETLLVVDCKRYARTQRVGVELVRSLYGVAEQLRATMAMLATTSFFTRPAQEFQRTLRHRVSLRDYSDLVEWLGRYRTSPGV